jgi:hypothetical protein
MPWYEMKAQEDLPFGAPCLFGYQVSFSFYLSKKPHSSDVEKSQDAASNGDQAGTAAKGPRNLIGAMSNNGEQARL